MNPECTRKHINQFCGTVTHRDLLRISTPERGQRLPQVPTVRIGIVAQQMSGRRDGFPDVRRGPQWVDAGAEIKNLVRITVQFSCGTVDIPAMQARLQRRHLQPAAIETPSIEAAAMTFAADMMSPGPASRPSLPRIGRTCAMPP